MEHYDAIVIGSGQAGTPLARDLAQAGRKTALIESAHVGGTCINEGCTPTKTMVASARVAYLARRAADYGVNTGPVTVNEAKVRERKRTIVESFRGGSERRLKTTPGLDLIFGTAEFTGPKAVQVKNAEATVREFTADHIFINTGTLPARPNLPGIDSVSYLDNSSIMELGVVPEHLLVLGGGYIGVEFGQMFRRFGSKVTILHSHEHLLSREDPDISAEIEKILAEDGIDLVLQSKAVRVLENDGAIILHVRTQEGERALTGSHLLVAVGRTPNTAALNLRAAGVETDARGFIRANGRLETSAPGVYVLGDVKGGPAFTHISYDDYRIIRDNLLHGQNRTTDFRLIPYTVFIDPQLGRVGSSETEALERGLDFMVARMTMDYVARALEMDESRGIIKVIIDAGTAQILGAAVLGIEGGEIMAMLEIAMMGHVPYTALRDGIFAHPTLAESLNNLFESPARSAARRVEPAWHKLHEQSTG